MLYSIACKFNLPLASVMDYHSLPVRKQETIANFSQIVLAHITALAAKEIK